VIELAAPITHLLARTFGAYQIKGARRRQEEDGGDPDFISRRSERQIVVFARRHLDVLVLEHRQRAGDGAACRMRHDDVTGGDFRRMAPVLK
jgi:hypothetical protein